MPFFGKHNRSRPYRAVLSPARLFSFTSGLKVALRLRLSYGNVKKPDRRVPPTGLARHAPPSFFKDPIQPQPRLHGSKTIAVA